MTKIHNMSIKFAAVGLKLTRCASLLSWFWPEQAFIDNTQVLIFSFFKNGLKNFLNYIFIITCTSFNILDQWSVVINWWSAHHWWLSQFQACIPSEAFVILLLPVVGICEKTSAQQWGICQILLEAVNVVLFLIFYFKICLFWIALDNSTKNFF